MNQLQNVAEKALSAFVPQSKVSAGCSLVYRKRTCVFIWCKNRCKYRCTGAIYIGGSGHVQSYYDYTEYRDC